ncbi:hypothetical protein M5K25_026190 [Dendrobium thyrsiflorum]|uniref:Gamma-butyrobetaine hydroxylase-like N-terminal domain-containing protein n=1 Tax=Dendrobium thyrsiflorum TaxID=117978 RepID=A0ABD0TWP0_DENTH
MEPFQREDRGGRYGERHGYGGVEQRGADWECREGFMAVEVEVEFSDGSSFNLSAEFLRVYSPAVDSKIRSVGGEKVRCLGGHVMKKMLEDKQKPATSESKETTGGHGRGGNLKPIRGRENPEVEILEGDDGDEYEIRKEGSLELKTTLLSQFHSNIEIRSTQNFLFEVIFGRRHVGIMSAEPIGNYGIRILFDDLHKTGIYTWDYFYHLGSNKFSLMRSYIKTLKQHSLSRDPQRRK